MILSSVSTARAAFQSRRFRFSSSQTKLADLFHDPQSTTTGTGRRRVVGTFASTTATASSEAVSALTERMRVEAEEEMSRVIEFFDSSLASSSLSKNVRLLQTPQDAFDYVDQNIDTVLFDCDGVVYRSPDPVPGAADCIRSLLQRNKQVYFVTNNAGSNRRQLREKLNTILQLNSDDDNNESDSKQSKSQQLTEDMMISSSYSCAQYLKQTMGTAATSLYVIGSSGLCDELRETGFTVFGGPTPPDQPSSMTRDELVEYDFEQYGSAVDAVVVGHDTDFNFRKLCIANVLLQRNAACQLIATNRDAFDLVGEDSRQIAGNGCVVAALEYSSKRTAINCGKPSQTLADLIARQVLEKTSQPWDPARTLMVGDRLDTDILFGKTFGMQSALVLTGVTLAEKIQSLVIDGEPDDEPLPTVILPHIGYMA